MPLKQCIVNGKKGWQYGNQYCFTGPNGKRDCIKQMIAIFGVDKFKDHLHGEAGLKEFGTQENITFAKAIYDEYFNNTKSNKYLSAVASYCNSKASPGDNNTDIDESGILGASTNTDNIVKPAGDLQDSDTSNDDGNEFNKPGTANMNENSKPSDKDNYGKDSSEKTPDGDEADKKVGASLKDGKPTEKSIDTDDPANNNADLNKPRENVGNNIVIPPYNKEAAPENEPGEYDEPRQTPPSRSDMNPSEASDKKFGMDDDVDNAVAAIADKYGYTYAELTTIIENRCWAYISQKERDKIPDSKFGDPENKGFPCPDKKHYELAWRLVGRKPAADQERIKKNLARIGRENGWDVPESYSGKTEATDDIEFQEQAVNGPSENGK